MFTTKKKLKSELAALQTEYDLLSARYKDMMNAVRETFPFDLEQIVYNVQLRNAQGRFTKTKASRDNSHIDEVVVDKKNYFKLVDKLNNNEVFTSLADAENYLFSVCVD